MLSEIEIKALVLNKLLKKGVINESSLIFNEMNLAGKERRLDLGYFSEGKIVAIEIKSEKDTLNRLEGQLAGYRRYFDRVILVVAKKFSASVLSIADSDVEIWEVDGLELKVVRKGKLIKAIDKRSYIDLMTRREIKILARQQNICHADLPIYELRNEVLSGIGMVSKEKVKLVLVDGFYNRFQMASNRFLNSVLEKGYVTSRDVPLLSPHSFNVILN